MDPKEHEYMHAHGIEHTHHDEQDPRHTHGEAAKHEHPHEGCAGSAGCGHDCGNCASLDPRSEAIALLQYMVKHNTAHANELAKLGNKLEQLGERMASAQVMQAVADYEKGNLRLSTVLAALNVPTV